jgi:G3E family GTPase
MNTYNNIPTNIISGFLGAGKTTAIQYLLKQKPEAEVWAVIVNEFGQIGVDGALLKNDSVAIKEIPGGCLCCVGSQALSVGLNKIIRSVSPQRILIEPTGLGHPAKLIASLRGEFYHSVLDLKASINLIDARHLSDDRYLNNETFVDQSNLADILVASKLDTYTEVDKNTFYDYVTAFKPEKLKVAMVEQGRLQLEWLDYPQLENTVAEYPQTHSHHIAENTTDVSVRNSQNWLMVESYANHFYSTGWKINNDIVFNQEKIMGFIKSLFKDYKIERLKGVMHTDSGWVSINFTEHEKHIQSVSGNSYSILEMISENEIKSTLFNSLLKACRSAEN